MGNNKEEKISVKTEYNGSLTREQFLFYETRTTAKLLYKGFSEEETIEKIIKENLFQFPTERMIKNLANVCVTRLKAMQDQSLIEAIATQPSFIAKQICLYAMMKQNRLVWDFMITVIGEKYRQKDLTFSKLDLNVFFLQLQEQNDKVATWSDKTIEKIKQVLVKVLVENEYLDDIRSEELVPVIISPVLENAIRSNNDDVALPAFNCFR